MLSRVIVRGRSLDLAAMMTYEQPVTFELLRSIFHCPMRITHERNTGTWYVDLDAGEPLYDWPDHIAVLAVVVRVE